MLPTTGNITLLVGISPIIVPPAATIVGMASRKTLRATTKTTTTRRKCGISVSATIVNAVIDITTATPLECEGIGMHSLPRFSLVGRKIIPAIISTTVVTATITHVVVVAAATAMTLRRSSCNGEGRASHPSITTANTTNRNNGSGGGYQICQTSIFSSPNNSRTSNTTFPDNS